jgi:hypothetical protein
VPGKYRETGGGVSVDAKTEAMNKYKSQSFVSMLDPREEMEIAIGIHSVERSRLA